MTFSSALRRLYTLVLLLCLPFPAMAAGGVISSADPRGSEAGQQILRAGGSATDAAIAALLALNVVEPQSSGIGGGGFLVQHEARTGLIASIDGRETAPASARPDRFLDAQGKPLPFTQAWPGGHSVGVPGNVRLMAMAHARWGKLPWARLFDPAITLAEEGFEVTPRLNAALQDVAHMWGPFPQVQALYWRDGKPAPVGTVIRNPAFAKLLRAIAANGPDAFYQGETAMAISAAVGESKAAPAELTVEELAGYRAKERAPVCGPYRGYKICGMGPPSSGGITVLQILGMLERFDLKALGKDDPRAWHLMAEAMRLAYADRDTYLGDPDFVSAPVAGLIDPAYLRARSRLIRTGRAANHYPHGTPPGLSRHGRAKEGDRGGTTHVVAVDGDGNISSYTSTVESAFGSQIIVNGMVLNNELTDFSFLPERDGKPVANRIEAGKRPLSSMAPTIVYDANDKPVFVVGAAGGRTIIMQVAKAIVAWLDWGLNAQEAIALPLIFFDREGVLLESGTAITGMKPALEKLGHPVKVAPLTLKANAAEKLADGQWRGAADPRSPGLALAE